jgi:hypothetical protein
LGVHTCGIVEDEGILERNDFSLHALNFGDMCDPAASVTQTGYLDNQVNGGRYLLAYGPQGEVHPGHEDQRFKSGNGIARSVSVNGGQRAIVAGVHGLEHVQ